MFVVQKHEGGGRQLELVYCTNLHGSMNTNGYCRWTGRSRGQAARCLERGRALFHCFNGLHEVPLWGFDLDAHWPLSGMDSGENADKERGK